METFTAVYANREIIVPTQSEADSLFQDGFGYRKNKTHYLNDVETLYNIERGKIIVINEETNNIFSFHELLQTLSVVKPDLWINFIVYKDLRTRGFIIEIKNKILKVYERGSYKKVPPSYQLKIISESKPEKVKKILKELEITEKEKLSMKIAVVDRRGEIVYYGVEEKKL